MTRNQTRRVEVACPVSSPELKDMLSAYLERILEDNTKAWRLQSDGNYLRAQPGEAEPLSVQSYYLDHPLQLQASAAVRRTFGERLRGWIHSRKS